MILHFAQAVVESIHWGLGSGLGSLLGGFAYNSYGAVSLFRSSAAISFLSTALAVMASIRYSSPRTDSTVIAFSAVPTSAPDNMEDGSTPSADGSTDLITVELKPMAVSDAVVADQQLHSDSLPVIS